MASPKITVVMSVYNNAGYVEKAIDSILAQTFRDFEFIIINDGSTDGSVEILDRYAAQDNRIKLVHQSNAGLVAALNTGISLARGDFIARMDGDDISLADRFQKQVDFLDAHPDIGAVGSWVTVIDEQGEPRAGGPDNPTDPWQLRDNLAKGTPILHPTAMMRRALVQQIGGYRAVYTHCEDYDLWLRFSEISSLANVPERLLLYRFYGGQVSRKHAVSQTLGTAIAYAAYEERRAGRPDPTMSLDQLPHIEAVDGLFGRAGMGETLQRQILDKIDYNVEAYAHGGTDLLVDAIRKKRGFDRTRAVKIAIRLWRHGQTGNALKIIKAIMFG